MSHSWDLTSGQKPKESGTVSSEGHSPDSCDVTCKWQELSKSTHMAVRQKEPTSLQGTRAGGVGQGPVPEQPSWASRWVAEAAAYMS